MKLSRRPPLVYLTLALVLASQGRAAEDSDRPRRDLSQSSLEELMNIEVSSVSRRQQRLSETAAAVFVITAEDIRRSGATSIPEALRLAPGVDVARIDASKWAISARGFNGRFANKLLVLIDGRSVYTNLYSGVYWDQNDVMIEDVERIEVIRGPGATMWGANAVNGVINVITKKARDTQGALLAVGTATDGPGEAAARYGGSLGTKAYYRLFTKGFKDGPMLTASGAAAYDAWHQARGGGRLDWEVNSRDTLAFHGDGYSGASEQLLAMDFPVVTGNLLERNTALVTGGYGLARWTRRLSDRSELALQTYFSQEERNELLGFGRFRTVDFDFQHRFSPLHRHDVTWGLGYRRMSDEITVAGKGAYFDPSARADNLWSAFVEDGISLVEDRLVFTLGSKFQHNAYTGFEIQPSARLLWTLNPRHSVWTAVSRAVRTPSRKDADVRLDFAYPVAPGYSVVGQMMGSHDFLSETETAMEAGYRTQIGSRLAFDIVGFHSRYGGLEGLKIGTAFFDSAGRLTLPISFCNRSGATVNGIEPAVTWTVLPDWKVTASHSWADYRFPLGGSAYTLSFSDDNSPTHQFKIRSSANLTRRLSLDLMLYRIGNLAGINVPSYHQFDARLGFRLTRELELSVGGRNLLSDRHLEFAAEDHVRANMVRRAAWLGLVWTH
jgi:iron complex outermembrane recepter protein